MKRSNKGDTNMKNIEAAVKECSNIVGQGNAFYYGNKNGENDFKANSSNSNIVAVIRPNNRFEVQWCLQIAAANAITVYSISRGYSMGFNSNQKANGHSILIDLSRMDGIIDFNERLFYITVQPGVTISHFCQFLLRRGLDHYVALGRGPNASLIGYYLEMDNAAYEYGGHLLHCGSLEVVLNSGEPMRIGFGHHKRELITERCREIMSRQLDGQLAQLKNGIITEATFWLTHFSLNSSRISKKLQNWQISQL